MTALGDERRIRDLMDEVNTGITPRTFETVFRSVPYAKHLQTQVLDEHVLWFFKEADEFLRLREAGKQIDEKTLARDYQRCKKLIASTRKKLKQLRTFVQKSPVRGPSRTAPVARSILEALASLQMMLTETFEDTLRDIEVNQRLRKNLHPKTANYEFNRSLHKYISYKFPIMKEADKASLIGAVKAGAKLFPATQLLDDHVESVQREITRAKQHEKKQRQNPTAIERWKNGPRLQKKKKQKAARRGQK